MKKDRTVRMHNASYFFQPLMQKIGVLIMRMPDVVKRECPFAISCQQSLGLWGEEGRVKIDQVDAVGF